MYIIHNIRYISQLRLLNTVPVAFTGFDNLLQMENILVLMVICFFYLISVKYFACQCIFIGPESDQLIDVTLAAAEEEMLGHDINLAVGSRSPFLK